MRGSNKLELVEANSKRGGVKTLSNKILALIVVLEVEKYIGDDELRILITESLSICNGNSLPSVPNTTLPCVSTFSLLPHISDMENDSSRI